MAKGITYNDLERALCSALRANDVGPEDRISHIVGATARPLYHLMPGYRPGWLLCACNRWWVPSDTRGHRGHVYDGTCQPTK